MSLVYGLLIIYGFGTVFVLCLMLRSTALYLVTHPIGRVAKILPYLWLGGIISAIFWPALLLRDRDFREVFIDFGRLAIPLGYLGCALATPIYPWIWAWFVGLTVGWVLLERYQESSSSKTG